MARLLRARSAARSFLLAVLALGVGLALQVGVNFANDYSDGVRGTDVDRIGPDRLTSTGKATPSAVKMAAFGSFGVAAVLGLILVALSGFWWLLGGGTRGDRRRLVLHGFRQAIRLCGLGRGQRLRVLWPGGDARDHVHAGWRRDLVGGVGVVLGWACSRSRCCWSTTFATSRRTPRPASARSRCGMGDFRARQFYSAAVTLPLLFSVIIAFEQAWVLLTLLLILPSLLLVMGMRLRVGAALGPLFLGTSAVGFFYGMLLAVGIAL